MPGALRAAAIASVIGLALPLAVPLATARAQGYNPLPEGFQFAAQAGFAWSTVAQVEPVGIEQFSRLRGTAYSLRMTHNVLGPLVGFVEAGAAQRGARVQAPGAPDAEYRTRWWTVTSGVSLVGRCVSFICPALDAGAGVSLIRQSLLYDAANGRPVGTIGTARYETSAVLGVRLAVPQWSGVAFVARHQEGLTNLLTGGNSARSRSQVFMLSLPLTR